MLFVVAVVVVVVNRLAVGLHSSKILWFPIRVAANRSSVVDAVFVARGHFRRFWIFLCCFNCPISVVEEQSINSFLF